MRPRPRPPPGGARRAHRVCAGHRAGSRLPQRGHGGVPARSRHRALSFHRGEPANSGGAHGHRAGHRHRPGAGPDPDCRRRGHRGRAGGCLPAAGRHRTAGPRRAVPDHDRGPARPIHSRLRADHRLPRRHRVRHSPRWRHRLHGRGHHPPLRFALGEGHRVGVVARGRDRPHAPRAPGVPDQGGRDQHRFSRAPRERRGVPARPGDDPLHRRQPGASRLRTPARPGEPPASLHRRDHRQRPPRGEGPARAAGPRPQSQSAALARKGARVRGEGAARRRGAGAGRSMDAGAGAGARHRHHHAGRAPVAARDPDAHPRSLPGRRRLRPQPAAALLARMLGRRHLRRGAPLPGRVPVGASGAPAVAGPEHPAADAAQGLQRGRLHQLPRQRGRGLRGPRGGVWHRSLPHLRPPELGREHARRRRCGAGDRAALRGGDLLHRRPARPAPQPLRPRVLPRHGPRVARRGHAHPRHQGHGGAGEARRRPRAGSTR